jgi:hypothetical protein
MLWWGGKRGPEARGRQTASLTPLPPPPPPSRLFPTHQFGTTALIMAVEANSGGRKVGVIRALLDGGANPNGKDSKGRTALSIAKDKGLRDVVDVLTQGGEEGAAAPSAVEEEAPKRSPKKEAATSIAKKTAGSSKDLTAGGSSSSSSSTTSKSLTASKRNAPKEEEEAPAPAPASSKKAVSKDLTAKGQPASRRR